MPAMKRKGKLPFDPKVFLSKVNGGRAISDYRKDQIVYTQGEPADSVFYIQSGKVKKTVVSEQGKEAVVALLETGDFFGEGCLTGQPLRLATVSAVTECVIARISKADITRVIHEEPAFAELFIAHLLARNSRVEEDLVDQLFNSSEKRLARTLLLLANFGKEGGILAHSGSLAAWFSRAGPPSGQTCRRRLMRCFIEIASRARTSRLHSQAFRDPFWKLSHRLRQLQPNHPEIVGGSGASKWDPGDDHNTVALFGCALTKHLRSSAVDHLIITRDVLGNHSVRSPQQRQ